MRSRTMNCKFNLLLFFVYFGARGLMASAFDAAVFARFKLDYLVSATDFQKYCTVALLPWSFKPLCGLISDRMPIRGYHKRPYVIAVGILGTGASTVLASVGVVLPVRLAVLCIFLVSLQIAVTDLLTESEYARVIVNNPSASASVIAKVWLCLFAGQILGASVSGASLPRYTRQIFWLTVPLAAAVCVPAVCGWYDDRVTPSTPASLHDNGLAYVAVAIATAAGTLGLSTMYGSWQLQLSACCLSTAMLMYIATQYLPRTTARCNMYMFLMCILNVQIPGTLDYFYTADEVCVPGGPGFSLRFFLLATGVIGAAAGAGAVLVFRYSGIKFWEFQSMFCIATVLRCSAALVDIALINRWNVRVGLDDTVFFVLGKAVVQPAILVLEQSPAVLLTSKLCTEHNESTIYAILAGFQNYGTAVATVIGTVLANVMQVHLSPTVCTFQYLPHLVATANIALPMMCVPLALILLPRGSTSTPSAHFLAAQPIA